MSDRMQPLEFQSLVLRILKEYQQDKTVFGLHTVYYEKPRATCYDFGPAAGPHTQMTQNIIGAYLCGARVIELKTVQTLDGNDLVVKKPCIFAAGEGYNSEWSTELTVAQAKEEYIKAWILIHVLTKEFGIAKECSVQFIVSIGYNLVKIQSEKINTFLKDLRDASQTRCFSDAISFLKDHLFLFSHLTKEDLEKIPTKISDTVTLSTLHGCPVEEIEAIASYLIKKKWNTYIKCNPTLLGYERAKQLLEMFGYTKLSVRKEHFIDDLHIEDAVAMIKRLKNLSKGLSLTFGVKVSNTLPVDNLEKQIAGEEIYLSGKALFPLAVTTAMELAIRFHGDLSISFSGGADEHMMKELLLSGLHPVTMVTTLLKPGGYQRLYYIAQLLEKESIVVPDTIDIERLDRFLSSVQRDGSCDYTIDEGLKRKVEKPLLLTDCGFAPCMVNCPLGQDICGYLKLGNQGRNQEALELILKDNPLPFITGEICSHPCMEACNRRFYGSSVDIRGIKLRIAENAYEKVLASIKEGVVTKSEKVAVIGAGPAGLACAAFLRRGGFSVTIYEKEQKPGGVPRYVIPTFRVSETAIKRDLSLIRALGVNIVTSHPITSIDELKKNYEIIVIATGAGHHKSLAFPCVNAIEFLRRVKSGVTNVLSAERIVVIGGGNTAVDAARTAIRLPGGKKVTLVYRRTMDYMPAQKEEINAMTSEGVKIRELLSPVSFKDHRLICEKMRLVYKSNHSRLDVVPLKENVTIDCDVVIAAVGEESMVPDEWRASCYVIGDALTGPQTIAQAIASAKETAQRIMGTKIKEHGQLPVHLNEIYKNRGNTEIECLCCDAVCELCTEVCPNRANVVIQVNGRPQILHLDALCNECGNCVTFCPYQEAPYQKKLTLFASLKAMEESENQGFYVTNKVTGEYKSNLKQPSATVLFMIETVIKKYSYLIP